jgi:DNA-directed RNA polymerase subunit RPC12/RpoP
MNWFDFVGELVGTRKFEQNKCAKCGVPFDNYQVAGIPHGIQVPYGTLLANTYPVVCERCYARFLIMVAEWFNVQS